MRNNNTIITIGRQFGSAGREIGVIVAKELGIELYDQEMLKVAAKESGLCEEFFKKHDERPTSSFLYSLVMDTYAMNYSTNAFSDMPLNHKVFLAQYNAIKKIADEGSCVLIGRCADYALDEYENCCKIFIHADMDDKVRRIARIYDLPKGKAREMILKADKKRASYYNYFTNKRWGDSESYDLSINSSKLGVEASAKEIIDYVRIRGEIKKKILL